MKKVFFCLFLSTALFFVACKKEKEEENLKKFPTKFSVDIPDAISNPQQKSLLATKGDTLKGEDIYKHIRTFIYAGESAAKLVEHIMTVISKYELNKPMSISYVSDEDGRTKKLVVVEKSSYESRKYEFELTVTDLLSEGNPDGGKALQIFWDTYPVRGVAILKPYNINRNENRFLEETMIRVDYSEGKEMNYDAHMYVYITGLPLANPLVDPYSMQTLKMFAGKKGNFVDVYGNSNHPNAKFFSSEVGFNYAFVGSSDRDLEIGVAEVGLPSSNLDTDDRNVILKENSIKNVFTNQIKATWPDIPDEAIATYLKNADAPGYFNKGGFIQGGVAPNDKYASIENRMNLLRPFNPNQVTNLSIKFK